MGAGCKLHINGIVEKRRSGLVGEVIRRLVGPDRPSADNRGTLSNGQERRQWLRPVTGRALRRRQLATRKPSQQRGLRAHCDETENPFAIHGDISRADVVAKLVLSGVAPEEAVGLDVSAREAGTVIGAAQRPDDGIRHRPV